MAVTLSYDEIFNSTASLLATMHQDSTQTQKIPSTIPSVKPIPFDDGLPLPKSNDVKGNGPVFHNPPLPAVDSKRNNLRHDDQPAEFLSNDPPPAYKKSDLDTTFDVIDKTLNSEIGQTALQSEIQKLGDSAASVETCFRNVARGLQKTLEVTTTKGQTSEMQKFQQTWDRHHKTYLKLLWQSRRVAGHARAIATDFSGDFLDVIKQQKYTVAEKKIEIASYREELNRDKANAEELSQGFVDLQAAVVEFQADLQQYAKRVKQLRQEIEKLTKDIEKIKVQLSKLTKETLLSAFATLGLGAAAAGALAVGAICPPLWVGAAYGAYKSYHSGKQCWNKYTEQRAVSNELNEKKKILEDNQRALEGMEKITTILTTLEDDMDFIQEKLGIFAQIWTFIHADLNEIEKQLERASNVQIQEYFEKKIRAVSIIYKSLARALYWYETNVHIQDLHTMAQF